MTKKFLIIALAMISLFSLGSCKGYRESDSEYYVTAICFKKEKGNFKVYAEVLAISSNGKQTSSKVFDASGKTPYDAVYAITSLMPKNAVFDHCGTAVIDSKTSGKDFKSIFKYLYDTKNLNLGIYMFAADDIEKILGCKSQSPSVGYDIMAIESNIKSNSGISFDNKYYEICSRQISTGGFCLPVVTSKDDRPAISGQKVYMGFDPVITLGKDDFLLYNLMLSGSRGGELEISGKRVTVNGVSSSVKTKGDTLRIKIKCRYRKAEDKDNGALKKELSRLLKKLSGSPAIKVLGAKKPEEISRAEVSVYGK